MNRKQKDSSQHWLTKLSPEARDQMFQEALRTARKRAFDLKNNSSGVFSEKFKKTYWGDPIAFVNDCFVWSDKERPTFYQNEILGKLSEKKRVCVRGPRGLGKTAFASWVILWYALTRDGDDWKAPTTAGSWRQLTKYLWPEIHKWARRLRWDKIGREPFDHRLELKAQSLKLKTGEAFAMASDNDGTTEGAHANHMLYLFDEAKIVPDSRWDSAEGAFSNAGVATGKEAFVLAISTPGEPLGRFYEIHQKKFGLEDWYTRHVTLDETIKAGLITAEWAEQRKRQWGESSAIYQNHVLGEFYANDELGIVPLAWLEAAYRRHDEWERAGKPGLGKLITVGADIAEGGNNKSVLAPLHEVKSDICDFAFLDFQEYGREVSGDTATMAICGKIVGLLGESNAKAVVDAVGIGSGITHRLAELKKNVVRFKGGEKTERKDFTRQYTYKDKNAAAWHGVRDLLNPEHGQKIAIPENSNLTTDLTTRHFTYRSDGVIVLESKDDLKKRLKRESGVSDSPDFGDACAMALFEMKTIKGGIHFF